MNQKEKLKNGGNLEKIKGWENLYEISNKGRVRSLDRKTRNNRAEFYGYKIIQHK